MLFYETLSCLEVRIQRPYWVEIRERDAPLSEDLQDIIYYMKLLSGIDSEQK